MKSSVLFCVLLFGFSMCAVKSVAQTTYYVATTGSDANPGTIDAPLLTIAKAVSLTSNGSNTTIYVRGGTYNSVSTLKIPVSGTKNGTAVNRIKLFGYPGDPRPLLNFSGQTVASSNIGVQLKASYWHIKGIDIYKAGDNGMHIAGSNNIIEFCTFFENNDSGLQLDDGAANNQVVNCDSYFNKDAADGNADGFAVKLLVGTGNSFRGCRAWNNSDDGWDGLLDDTNNGNPSTTYDSCICFRNGYLKNNSASVGNGNGFKMGGNNKLHDAKLTRCLAMYNRSKGFDQNNNNGSMTLYNCTGYKNGRNYGMANNAPDPGEVMVLKNCVSYAGVNSNQIWAGATLQNNSWQGFTVTDADFLSVDTAGITGPRKPDGSLSDFNFMHLAPGSDLINAGVDVGLPFLGAAPDLGAFEYNPALPVKLASFTAITNDKDVTLNWSMTTESQNKGWTIERANVNNNASWTDLGFVKGAGNSNAATKYSFPDNAVSAGTYYYRLKQIDNNGKIAYSNTLLVIVGKKMKGIDMASYPNPFRGSSTIRFNVPTFSKVNLSVYNEEGKFVKTISNEMLDAGTYQKLFTGNELAAGRYILKLQVGNEWVTSSIIRIQ